MPTSFRRSRQRLEIPFDEVCARLDLALQGAFRHDIIAMRFRV
jgi:hypothetical protein